MGNFKDLPTDIILDILTRLPTETVLDCKFVCRPWRNLVSHHPSFSRLHLARINHSPDSGKLSYLIVDQEKYQQLHYFKYIDNKDETPPIHSIRRMWFSPTCFRYNYSVIGSINGLVCFYGLEGYCISNPLSREYVMLPKIKRDDRFMCRRTGFGYLPLTNEYKVVEICELRGGESSLLEVAVYTLGSGNRWRNVGRLDSKFSLGDGVFLNGALYWMDRYEKRVFVFDLTEEKFRDPITLPLLPTEAVSSAYTLGKFGGVLFFLQIRGGKRLEFDIWLLKEKNDNVDLKEQVEYESLDWKKEFTLPEIEPLAFTKSGGVLCFNSKFLRVYNATSTSKKLAKFKYLLQILPHQMTLVSLKETGQVNIEKF